MKTILAEPGPHVGRIFKVQFSDLLVHIYGSGGDHFWGGGGGEGGGRGRWGRRGDHRMQDSSLFS